MNKKQVNDWMLPAKNAIENGDLFIKKLGFAEEIIILEEKENIPENAMSIMTLRK